MDLTLLAVFIVAAILGAALAFLYAKRSTNREEPLQADFPSSNQSGVNPALALALDPVRDLINDLSTRVDISEKHRVDESQRLFDQFTRVNVATSELKTQTGKLNQALNRSEVRGSWGELQLQRIVEATGMVNHIHYLEQEISESDGKRLIPDMVVQLDGERRIIVDSKVPLDALLRESDTTEISDHALQSLAKGVKTHIDSLSKKNYSKLYEQTPDFVVMFVPAESLLSLACQADPGLLEYAFDRNIVPATPTTLIALLKAAELGWKNHKITQNAHEILTVSQELVNRLGTFTSHLDELRKGLDKANASLDSASKSWTGRVSPQMARVNELGLNTDKVRELNPGDLSDINRVSGAA